MHTVISFCLGELWWEFANFAPHIFWKRVYQYNNRNDVVFVALTRQERFDIYGLYVDILTPLRIEGDGTVFKSNGFRLDGFSYRDYYSLISSFKSHFEKEFTSLELVFPVVGKKKRDYLDRNMFPRDKMIYEYFPRRRNKEIVENLLPKDKSIVCIAPRFRSGLRRNWKYWQEFYDLLYEEKELLSRFFFVICGKSGEYVEDKENRFLELAKVETDTNSSLIGITIETIKKAVLTVGSQSAIPNISLLLGTPALEWGHERRFHTVDYNFRKTKVTFIDDFDYCISPEVIMREMKKELGLVWRVS